MPQVKVTHQTITMESPDEAESMAGYLSEHGIFVFVTDEVEVRAASQDADADQLIRTLQTTWQSFWDNSDSGLFGLPMFIKES